LPEPAHYVPAGCQPTPGQPAQYERAQYEQAQYEQAQYEQAQYEQAQYEQAQYERAQYERAQYEPIRHGLTRHGRVPQANLRAQAACRQPEVAGRCPAGRPDHRDGPGERTCGQADWYGAGRRAASRPPPCLAGVPFPGLDRAAADRVRLVEYRSVST
jgi:multidrug efflux pump subunit AcrA (membrane-fusion protein)